MKGMIAPVRLVATRKPWPVSCRLSLAAYYGLQAIIALLASCLVCGFLVATQPLSIWVFILCALVVVWVLARVVLNSSNPAWSALVVVASGNLDPRTAGINVPVISTKEGALCAVLVLACGVRLAADLLHRKQDMMQA
ncbi:MAG: hypothetical protein M1305_06800, partial [Candidatus Marsarchaeota archaeon]|nr:hypothetical protein [Candidatus Marsarchaeota archaeon]